MPHSLQGSPLYVQSTALFLLLTASIWHWHWRPGLGPNILLVNFFSGLDRVPVHHPRPVSTDERPAELDDQDGVTRGEGWKKEKRGEVGTATWGGGDRQGMVCDAVIVSFEVVSPRAPPARGEHRHGRPRRTAGEEDKCCCT